MGFSRGRSGAREYWGGGVGWRGQGIWGVEGKGAIGAELIILLREGKI